MDKKISIVMVMLCLSTIVWSQASRQECLKRIMESGDGKSLQTAFEVQNIDEEYMIMRHLKIPEVKRQTLLFWNGNKYDKIESQTTTIYFRLTNHKNNHAS